MQKYAAAVLVVAVAATLSACGGQNGSTAGSTGGAKTGGTLALGTVQAPTSFAPGEMNATGPVPQMYQPVYDSLIRLDKNGEPTPSLATSFKYDSANTKLTLQLRTDVKFSDGTPLDAQAVKSCLDVAMKGTGESGTQLSSVDKVTAVSASSVEIDLKAPDPSLVRHLGGSAGMIASPKVLTGGSLKTTPVGSGPYVMAADQSTAGSKYTYTRNASYWGGKDAFPFDTIVVTVFNDNAAQLNALRSQQINGGAIGQKDVNAAKGSGLTILNYPQYTSSGLYLFDREGKLTPALGKVEVRQAINYAINRQAFVDQTQGGTGVATDQLFNSESSAYDKGLNDQYAYNLDKAKQLMSQAGYGSGFTVTMPDSSPIYPQEQAFLTEALKAINITVNYEPVNGQAFIGNILSGKYSMVLFQLNTGVEWDVVTQTLQQGSLWNPFHVADPTIDAAVAEAQKATGDAQAAAYKKVNRAVLDKAWFAIINQPGQFYATTKGVTATPERFGNYPPIYNYAKS